MPQLLKNIGGIIDSFKRYARLEGDCTVLTRGELKRLLETEFSDVIVRPHDPVTVNEILRLLDEDKSGTVDFKEFLVLTFKVAQACYETLSKIPEGTCGLQTSQELGDGQRSGAGTGRAEEGQWQEGSLHGQAPMGQGRAVIENQGGSATQLSGYDELPESQRQKEIQKTQARGDGDQTHGPEGEQSHRTGENPSKKQTQSSQQDRAWEGARVTAKGTQAQEGVTQAGEQDRSSHTGSTDTQSQEPMNGQTTGTVAHDQEKSQTSQVVAGGHSQTQIGSHTRVTEQSRNQTGSTGMQSQESVSGQTTRTVTHDGDRTQTSQVVIGEQGQTQVDANQTVEQGRSQWAEYTGTQSQGSMSGQTSGNVTHSQDRTQTNKVVTRGHSQTQTGPHSLTHTQTPQQNRNQTGSTGTQSQGPMSGQTSGNVTQSQDRTQTSQVVTGGHNQTQTGSHTQAVEQGWTQTTGHERTELEGWTQTQSRSGPRWAHVSNFEAGETVPRVQTQTGAGPGIGRQAESKTTTTQQEWTDDHSSETVSQKQGQETVQKEGKPGMTASGLYSYLKSTNP